jgi:phosphoenolpyruvate synthase/pyruvate phosphate dikinase
MNGILLLSPTSGAPLSHAAIAVRELGIPAVVGCRNATVHLRNGDRVRVDGGRASSRCWAAKTAHVTNARILHLANVSRSEFC